MPSSERWRADVLLGGVTLGLAIAAATWPVGTTNAAYSDFALVTSTVSAGVWAPDVPAACGEFGDYAGVVYGTSGDDVIHGTDQPQIIMALGGDDTVQGGGAGDCLVGGDGDDRLTGSTATDILLGGGGADVLDGGNGTGGPAAAGSPADTCLGGSGRNVVSGCDVVAPPAAAPDSGGATTPSPAAELEARSVPPVLEAPRPPLQQGGAAIGSDPAPRVLGDRAVPRDQAPGSVSDAGGEPAVEAPSGQPVSPEAPAERPATSEIPSEQPVTPDVPSEQPANPDVPSEQPAA